MPTLLPPFAPPLAVFTYGASLVLTYVNQNVGMRMHYAEYRTAGWYHNGEEISEGFDPALTTWHTVNVLRLMLPLAAWGLMLTDEQCQMYSSVVARVGNYEVSALGSGGNGGGSAVDAPWDTRGQLPAGFRMKPM